MLIILIQSTMLSLLLSSSTDYFYSYTTTTYKLPFSFILSLAAHPAANRDQGYTCFHDQNPYRERTYIFKSWYVTLFNYLTSIKCVYFREPQRSKTSFFISLFFITEQLQEQNSIQQYKTCWLNNNIICYKTKIDIL